MRLTAFVKCYMVCTLLHSSKLNILAKNQQLKFREISALPALPELAAEAPPPGSHQRPGGRPDKRWQKLARFCPNILQILVGFFGCVGVFSLFPQCLLTNVCLFSLFSKLSLKLHVSNILLKQYFRIFRSSFNLQ